MSVEKVEEYVKANWRYRPECKTYQTLPDSFGWALDFGDDHVLTLSCMDPDALMPPVTKWINPSWNLFVYICKTYEIQGSDEIEQCGGADQQGEA